jgi:hypothetical protein
MKRAKKSSTKGPGRPALPPELVRSNRFAFRLTDSEVVEWIKTCARVGHRKAHSTARAAFLAILRAAK